MSPEPGDVSRNRPNNLAGLSRRWAPDRCARPVNTLSANTPERAAGQALLHCF